ncbi:MAG: Bug family tripartite tricarboxylate transporter substrate binding protein [Burkholderiales bacterium]
MKSRLPFVSLALALTMPSPSFAQGFPNKPVRIIVSAAPSVPNDIISRGLTEPLAKAFGQAVVVENRVGADGMIGMEACAKSGGDGYTICSTASNVIIWNPVLRSKLPYDPIRDFTPVVHVGFFDSVLIAHPSVPANSVQQLFDMAKAKPDSLTWAHFGSNSTGYMYQDSFRKLRGAPFYAVPYKTQPQVLQAMLAGEAQVSVYSIANTAAHIQAGKLKALATTAEKRLADLPNVPTFDEIGIKLPLRTWFGFHLPAATPRELVTRYNGEIRKALAETAFKETILKRQGVLANDGTPEQFDAYIKNQIKEVSDLVKSLGIKPE